MTVDRFGMNKELVLEFFCTFSRCEYSLKRAGFAKGGENRVDPDWDGLGKKLRGLSPESLEPVLNCCEYLRKHPPDKQVLRDGQLDWSDSRDTSLSAIEQLLMDVRRVRNNLFHGGKFPDGPKEETARNELLMRDSLAVLYAVLKLPCLEQVRVYFSDGSDQDSAEPAPKGR